jgi:hypothetical protein
MVDIGSIAGLASSLRVAGEITKAMIGIRDGALLQAKVIELQGVILAAQSSALGAHSEQFATAERMRTLEAQVAELEGWEVQKQRYQLTDYGSGTFAYALKKGDTGGEPPHRACATCFDNKQRSILQFKDKSYLGQEVLHCPRCKTDVNLGTPREPPDYTPTRGGSGWTG